MGNQIMTLKVFRFAALWYILRVVCFVFSVDHVESAMAEGSYDTNDRSYYFTSDPTFRRLVFSDNEERITLGSHFQYVLDKSDQWKLDDVIGAQVGALFRDTYSEVPNFGLTDSVYWFRLALKYEGHLEEITREFDIEFSQLAEIDFYILNVSGESQLVRGGFRRSSESADIKSRYFVSALHFTAGETKWIYVKVDSKGPLILPSYLWEPEARFQVQRLQLMVFGLFYGIIMAMFIYNLFLFVWMRLSSYFFYVIYIGSIGLVLSVNDGTLREYFLSGSLWVSSRLMYFLASVSIISALQFCRLMLATSTRHPLLDKALLAGIAVGILTSLLTMVHYSLLNVLLVVFLAIAVGGILLAAGAISMSEGFREGKFFFFAWSILCLSVIILSLLYAGVVPFNMYTINVMYLGTALEAVLLSFFLADRINTTALEKLAIERVAKEELELSFVNLDNSHRLKSEFFATVSHELRTPMNGVVGMLDLMSNTRLDKEQATHVEVAIKFARLMMFFVDNLLGFSEKAESNNLIVKPFELRESLDYIRLRFLARCHSRGLLFDYKIADNVPDRLIGDCSRLQGVLSHLLDNAVKYTDQGSVRFGVSCRPNEMDRKKITLVFFIIDTGKGIPNDKLKDVFNPFSHSDDSSDKSNLGIGLSLCKKSATVMESDIKIKSQVGEGTQVQFSVPLELDDSDKS